jgi:hypothetical protein
MNADERQTRIAELQREADEGRARIAEHERQRAENPALEQDYLMASEPVASPPVRENDAPRGVIRKRFENPLPPAPEPEPSDDGDVWHGLDRFTKATADALDRDARELAELRGKIERLEADKRERAIRDQTIVERSGRIVELQRENADSRAQLQRKQLEQALAERDARIDKLETRLNMLLGFISPSLPRGWGRDDV